MAKKKVTKKAPVSAPTPAGPRVSNIEAASAVSKQERIALLAYSYWEQRGCQGGSPEEDWLRAEREIELAYSS